MRWTRPRLAALQERLRAAYPDARCALDHQDPFQLVVATVLSAQCTDARVNLVTPALFARFPDPESLAAALLADLEALIRSTGFFHTKAKNLIGMAQALVSRHGGEVPADPAALGRLPGVGQKTANVVLANAFGVPAMAVDTHIFRVARRLGLSEARTPEKVEADLCRQFPEGDWIGLHHQLILHGRRACHAPKPACGACPLRAECPTGLGRIPDPHTGEAVVVAAPREVAAVAPAALVTDGPQRIVSLVPSVTELLAGWGLASRLAGRTRHCVQPPWIRATVPSVGGTKDPDLPTLLSLRPDLVLLETDENDRATAAALTAAGVPWLALELRTVAACARACLQLGRRLGAEAQGKAAAEAIRRAAAGAPRGGPRALVLVWHEAPKDGAPTWMAAGPDTYLGDLLRRSGFRPVGPDRYPVLDGAALRALDPHLLVLPDEPFRFTARHRSALQTLLPGARVVRAEGRALTWYLSRTVAGLEFLRGLRA